MYLPPRPGVPRWPVPDRAPHREPIVDRGAAEPTARSALDAGRGRSAAAGRWVAVGPIAGRPGPAQLERRGRSAGHDARHASSLVGSGRPALTATSARVARRPRGARRSRGPRPPTHPHRAATQRDVLVPRGDQPPARTRASPGRRRPGRPGRPAGSPGRGRPPWRARRRSRCDGAPGRVTGGRSPGRRAARSPPQHGQRPGRVVAADEVELDRRDRRVVGVISASSRRANAGPSSGWSIRRYESWRGIAACSSRPRRRSRGSPSRADSSSARRSDRPRATRVPRPRSRRRGMPPG